MPKLSPSRRPAARALALPFAALAAAALGNACSRADGQPAAAGATAAPTVRVDASAPRADSGVVAVARAVTPAVVYIEVEVPRTTAGRGGGQPPRGFEGIPPGMLPPASRSRASSSAGRRAGAARGSSSRPTATS
jgi:hypothetical protein